VLWGGAKAIEKSPDRPFLTRIHVPELDHGLLARARWQSRRLPHEARRVGANVLFVPAGSTVSPFRPFVSMSQNMLPFEPREAMRYGLSRMSLRLAALRLSQGRTAQKADGYVFLTEYARSVFARSVGTPRRSVIVPHGVDARFRMRPRPQAPLSTFSNERPFRLLYVSIIDVYKHQWHVVEAVGRLRRAGLPVTLDLVGPAYPPALRRLQRSLHAVDPQGSFIRYRGPVPFEDLHHAYAEAHAGIFASSCENQPIILLEGMAAGLPLACSDRGPMPEVLGDAGILFDPERPASIAEAVERLMRDDALRARISEKAFERTDGMTWRRTADRTLAFLASVARGDA